MSEQKMYLYAFTQIEQITPKRFKKIQNQFQNDLCAAWHYPYDWDIQVSADHRSKIINQYKLINPEKSFLELEKENINIISYTDLNFPYQFKHCSSPPFALFYKGTLPTPQQRLLTVVGSRKMTSYGEKILEELLPSVLKNKIGIASGLAYGVDKYAHEIALKNNAYTLAVLPSGLDVVTPRNHYQLAENILRNNGCLISEIPPGQKINKGAFPRRNRLLAALGEVTLVIEAAHRSGSKITAHQALDAGKDVACVPGSIFSEQSQGCHDLIKLGATPICSASDLLDLLNLDLEDQKVIINLSDEENIIKKLLENNNAEDVLDKSPFSLQKTLEIITQLEIKN